MNKHPAITIQRRPAQHLLELQLQWDWLELQRLMELGTEVLTEREF